MNTIEILLDEYFESFFEYTPDGRKAWDVAWDAYCETTNNPTKSDKEWVAHTRLACSVHTIKQEGGLLTKNENDYLYTVRGICRKCFGIARTHFEEEADHIVLLRRFQEGDIPTPPRITGQCTTCDQNRVIIFLRSYKDRVKLWDTKLSTFSVRPTVQCMAGVSNRTTGIGIGPWYWDFNFNRIKTTHSCFKHVSVEVPPIHVDENGMCYVCSCGAKARFCHSRLRKQYCKHANKMGSCFDDYFYGGYGGD